VSSVGSFFSYKSRVINLPPPQALVACCRLNFTFTFTFTFTFMWKLFSKICWNKVTVQSFIHLVALRQVRSLIQSQLSNIVRSRASSFKWEYPLLSLRSSSSFLHLLPRLPVTSIPPFIFPSITHCRRQFLRKMWPIQLAFRFLISCRIFLCSLTLSNTSSFLAWSVQLVFSTHLQHHISKLSRCFWSTARNVHYTVPCKKILIELMEHKITVLVSRSFTWSF